ncbi:MAG: hypothetical protein ACK5U4_16260 [Rhodospirillales bacterium]|jgi:hypothetical protein
MIELPDIAAEALLDLTERNDDDLDRLVVIVLPRARLRFIVAKPKGDPLSPYQVPNLVHALSEAPELLEDLPVTLTFEPIDEYLVATGGWADAEYRCRKEISALLVHEITMLASGAISQRDSPVYVLICEEAP